MKKKTWFVLFAFAFVADILTGGVGSMPTGALHESSVVISNTPASKGILVLAHGGTELWNDNVIQTLKAGELHNPMVVHFGMGIQSAGALEDSFKTLESLGVQEVLVVPLFVSSHSLVMRQLIYLLGLEEKSPFHTGLSPIDTQIAIRVTQALDGSPEVGDVLIDRTGAISTDPARESVVIVAHGPVEDADNQKWLAMMNTVREQLLAEYAFKAVHLVTLRDDAAAAVRDKAAAHLRRIVLESSRDGEALVVPLLISAGGIEHKILNYLDGLEYRFSEEGLLPHPKIRQWVTRQIESSF